MPGFGYIGLVRERTRRLLAGALAALAVFFQAFSVAYIVHEADHDCCGEGCPVCLQLQDCLATFQLTGPCEPDEPQPVQVPATGVVFDPASAVEPPAITLVSLKVRMND